MRLLVALGLLLMAAVASAGVLEDYVQRPDGAWHWSVRKHGNSLLAEYWFIELESQQWLDTDRVDRPFWTHELRIVRPHDWTCRDGMHTHTAVLFISGGSNRGQAPEGLDLPSGLVARALCRTVVEIRQVPNEPLVFFGEHWPRREDEILAYTLGRFLQGDGNDWPVHEAMVKAVVRAMDTAQALSRQEKALPHIDDFVVLGSSKRGWAAWLTAAVDPRVRALAVASIDMPDLAQQLPHQLAAYGDYGRALAPYKAVDLACRMQGGRGDALLGIIDPVRYLDRLALPKYILNSAGDEFFVSDASRFYFHRLPGDNRMRYTVNTGHSQQSSLREELALIEQVRHWVDNVIAGRTPPRLDWEVRRDGEVPQLVVTPSEPPRRVRLWTADNPSTRDFRKETLGPVWVARELRPGADGIYRVDLRAAPKGWRASLVEAEFGGWRASSRQTYTTDVFVEPETLPYSADPCARSVPAVGPVP